MSLIVGVDPGVETGLAEWCTTQARLIAVDTVSIITAMDRVRAIAATGLLHRLVVEDARLRRGGFGRADEAQERSGAGIREGVGSVKRDCKVWEEFCREYGISGEFVAPAASRTKLPAAEFRAASGWPKRCSQHGRDAAMLVLAQLGTRPAAQARPAARGAAASRPGDGAARCASCGHPESDHMPGWLRCPLHVGGAFARYGTGRFSTHHEIAAAGKPDRIDSVDRQ